ncbi:T9SS type A sorting domain-containing protein [Bacteroidota bacterium]
MKKIVVFLMLLFGSENMFSQENTDSSLSAIWTHTGRTSAVIYWQLEDISKEAQSYVEYGETEEYGNNTEITSDTRRAQLHHINGLNTGQEYHYRMVLIDNGKEAKSEDRTFTTNNYADAIEITNNPDGSVITLDQVNTTYILTEDIRANADAIDITADGVTLELDGHTVNFSQSSDAQYITGILVSAPNAKVYNGKIIQGDIDGGYSYAIGSRGKADGIEFAGLYLDVNRPNAYPMNLFKNAQNIINIHHNYLYSTVKEIESRHYPGNDLIRIDAFEENAEVSVHHNLLTEGCHCGISLRGAAKELEIYDNDIRHHQQFVNGYALFGEGLIGGKIHGNRISSVGRTIHLTAPDIEFYNNWTSTKGHMTLSDMPQGSGIWLERRVELHGIKFEGNNAKNIKVHDNYMEINQPQPDSAWDYVPATPLNLACYDPNAMNEIYNNKIVAYTTYRQTHHGPYGESGEWASALYFVGMNNVSDPGMYSAYIHDNEFISNDLFISGDIEETHIVRIEDNVFRLGTEPTYDYAIFRTIPAEMQDRVINGNNTFIMDDTTSGVEKQFNATEISKLYIFPNPVSGRATISFTMSKCSKANISITNSLGIRITDLVNDQFMEAGLHSIDYDASNLPAGVYFCTLSAGGYKETVKMIILK